MKTLSMALAAVLLSLAVSLVTASPARAEDSGRSIPGKAVRAGVGCVYAGIFDVGAVVYGAAGTIIIQGSELVNMTSDPKAHYGDLTKSWLGMLWTTAKDTNSHDCAANVRDLLGRKRTSETTPSSSAIEADSNRAHGAAPDQSSPAPDSAPDQTGAMVVF